MLSNNRWDGNPITDDEGKPWEGMSLIGSKTWSGSGNWFMNAYFWILLNLASCYNINYNFRYIIYKQKLVEIWKRFTVAF